MASYGGDDRNLIVSIDPAGEGFEHDLRTLAGVAIPALRASAYEFELILDDALRRHGHATAPRIGFPPAATAHQT